MEYIGLCAAGTAAAGVKAAADWTHLRTRRAHPWSPLERIRRGAAWCRPLSLRV